MRAAWSSILVPAFAVIGGLVAGCGGGGSCDDIAGLAGGTVCPPPTYAHARVTGTALRSDGSPIAGKEARLGCGDVVGEYSDLTDAQGNFEMRVPYAVEDTTLVPFPPRAADGSFELRCLVSLQLTSTVTLRQEQVAVRFTPAGAAVVPTVVELRE